MLAATWLATVAAVLGFAGPVAAQSIAGSVLDIEPGAALLCGIGFTMSLFIASLAFEGEAASFGVQSRLGILAGSIAAGMAGFLVLRYAPAQR